MPDFDSNPYAAPGAEIASAPLKRRRFRAITVVNAFVYGTVFGLAIAAFILFAGRHGWLAFIPRIPVPSWL